MDGTTLAKAMGGALAQQKYDELAPHVDRALQQANCTTVNRAAMFCAQIGHESGGLHWMEELADGSAYENRHDLGNTQPGDGKRFKGRGPIQITGRSNYANLSRWAHQHGHVQTSTYFVDHPEHLALETYAFLGAVWYWTVARPGLNQLADTGQIKAVTKEVNGGYNGLADRTQRWRTCRKLGAALLPDTQGTIYLVTASVLNGRKSPGGAIVNHLKNGDIVHALFTIESGGRTWTKCNDGLYYASQYLKRPPAYVVTAAVLNGRDAPGGMVVVQRSRGYTLRAIATTDTGGHTWIKSTDDIWYAAEYLTTQQATRAEDPNPPSIHNSTRSAP